MRINFIYLNTKSKTSPLSQEGVIGTRFTVSPKTNERRKNRKQQFQDIEHKMTKDSDF